ncbi:MAG: DUF4340 domain-containing protein [Gemmatimonadetes bacterium]|nr:DUF4340 domain-containing protein [Gemmatimonadota bacterium]
MNAKQLRLVAILLGLAVLFYLPRLFRDDGSAGSIQVGDGFAFSLTEPPTRVDVVDLAAGDTLRLERAAAGWTVDGYRADSVKVTQLLDALPDLTSQALVARNPANHASMEVGSSSGRRIEVYTEAGGPVSFHLGARDLSQGGYHVRSPDEDAVYRLEGPIGGYLTRDRDAWRVRLIASVDTSMVRELVLRRDGVEAVVRRGDDAAWSIDGAPADTTAVVGILRMLPSLSASGFPTDEEAVGLDFAEPGASLDAFASDESDVTGRRLVLSLRLLADEDRGDWLARTADGAEIYRLASFNVDRLLPEALLP